MIKFFLGRLKIFLRRSCGVIEKASALLLSPFRKSAARSVESTATLKKRSPSRTGAALTYLPDRASVYASESLPAPLPWISNPFRSISPTQTPSSASKRVFFSPQTMKISYRYSRRPRDPGPGLKPHTSNRVPRHRLSGCRKRIRSR